MLVVKLVIIHVLFTLMVLDLIGASTYYYSIANGNWNSGATWSLVSGGSSCGCNPGNQPGSSTYIYVESNISLNIASLNEKGYLEIASGKSVTTTLNSVEIASTATLIVYGTLEVYDLTFYNGSKVTVYPGGSIIVHNNFINKNNSNNVFIDGSITVSGVFDNGNGGVITGTGVISASEFTGNGITFGYTNSSIPDGSFVSQGSLPVNLLYFNGNASQGKVYLQWATASEINNNYFEVQRSEDAVTFNKIATINGAGNSNSIIKYEYVDQSYTENKVYYYRLHQVDFNGDNSTSEIIAVEVGKNYDSFIRIGNSENYLLLLFTSPLSGNYKVQVFDNNGRIVLQQNEVLTENTTIRISKQSLNNSIYSLVISSGNETYAKKAIVVH